MVFVSHCVFRRDMRKEVQYVMVHSFTLHTLTRYVIVCISAAIAMLLLEALEKFLLVLHKRFGEELINYAVRTTRQTWDCVPNSRLQSLEFCCNIGNHCFYSGTIKPH